MGIWREATTFSELEKGRNESPIPNQSTVSSLCHFKKYSIILLNLFYNIY